MATAEDGGESVKCPICLEQYMETRKLPNCEHSFYEECLITYAGKLMDNNEIENGILCPFCRTINPSPKDRDGIRVWCQSLEKNENIQLVNSESNEKKSARNGNKCDSCSAFGISTKATQICNNCFELFCVPCSVGCHSQRSYRNHKVRDLDIGSKDNIKDINMKDLRIIREYSICSTHSEMELKYLCKDDGRLCCNTCLLTSHRQCQKVDELKGDALETEVKSETEELKNLVNKLNAFAKSIIDAKVTNTKDNEAVPENIRKTVQELKTKIINILDSFEETAIEQAKAIVKNVKLSEEKDIETLKGAIIDLGACLSLTDTVTKYGSVSHSYVVLEKIRETFKKYENVITNIADALESVTPVLKLENEMQSFVDLGPNDTNTLGHVTEKRLGVSVPLYQSGYKILKITKSADKSIRETYTGKSSPTYSHLTFLPNDCAFLVGTFNGYCSLTNDRYDVVAFRSMAACCPCFIKNETVAVNNQNQRKIHFLGVDKDTINVIDDITTKRKPAAIQVLKNGDFAVAWNEPVAFGIISYGKSTSETVYFSRDKHGREIKSFQYMAVDESRKQVIQRCTTDKAVYCFDYEGYPKFTFTNVKLKNPKGVALDRDGNIYVCSCTPEPAIHVISPAGEAIKVISEGCPKYPLAIAFKRNGEEFAVTQCDDYRLVTFFKLQRP